MATEREGDESGERVPGTGEAQNASGSNAHTRSSAGTPRDPLGALSRTAHRIGETNSNIDEEVDGGVVARAKQVEKCLETEESGCGACGACGACGGR